MPKNIDYEGIYAISIDTSDISGCLLDCLRKNKNNESIIYLGKGNVLSSRLGQELKAEGAGIFFSPARKLFDLCGFKKCKPFAHYKEDVNSVYMSLLITK